MTIIDHRGRLFGRFNLVDLTIAVFMLAIVPIAYGIVLLFRPSMPHIDSVTRVAIGKQERRIAGGAVINAKLKLKGSGFSPMHRALVGNTEALAFVFESPNSADLIVGNLPPGSHDVVLFDGVQEVARAPKAVVVEPETSESSVRLEGWLTGLDPDQAAELQVGSSYPSTPKVFDIVALGPARPAASRVSLPDGAVDLPLDGRVDRQAVLNVRCDARRDEDPCRVLGQSVADAIDRAGQAGETAARTITLPGPSGAMRIAITDVFPPTPPRSARVRVRLAGGPELALVAVGDRDDALDSRAAVVTGMGARESTGPERAVTVTLAMGLDDSREGWRYRGQLVKPGGELRLATTGYVAGGVVQSIQYLDDAPSRNP